MPTVMPPILFTTFAIIIKELAVGQSEVAQLRTRILNEYEAMKRGLSGVASGTARHEFIDARMRHVDGYYKQLSRHVGEQEATNTITDLYQQVIG
jgi:hypothetical protein